MSQHFMMFVLLWVVFWLSLSSFETHAYSSKDISLRYTSGRWGWVRKTAFAPLSSPISKHSLSHSSNENVESSVNHFTNPNVAEFSLSGRSCQSIIPTGPSLCLSKLDSSDVVNSTSLLLQFVPPYMTDEQRERSINYFQLINSYNPDDMISKFTNSTPMYVQEGVKTALLNVLGNLPNYAFDASLLTTSNKLASLLFQMQVTGYMFKNAEYRMTLTRSLKGVPKLPPKNIHASLNAESLATCFVSNVENANYSSSITVDGAKLNFQELIVIMSRELLDLRNELSSIRKSRESELKSNLLTYIQALPEKELLKLSSDISEEVLQAMRLLVEGVMNNMDLSDDGTDNEVHQTMGNLAQLCMWQLISGYKLRELEALELGASID